MRNKVINRKKRGDRVYRVAIGKNYVKIYRLNRYFVGYVNDEIKEAFACTDWDFFAKLSNNIGDVL